MNLSLVISLFSFTITITYGAPTLAGSRHNTITKESVSQEVATHGEEENVKLYCNETCDGILQNARCNEESKICECVEEFPVQLHIGCTKPSLLGEPCLYSDSCTLDDPFSTCLQINHNAYCRCISGYHEVPLKKQSKKAFCSKDTLKLDKNMRTLILLVAGVAVFSTLICFVLKLFAGDTNSRRTLAVNTRVLSSADIAQMARSFQRSNQSIKFTRRGNYGVTVSSSRAAAARAAAILLVSCNIPAQELPKSFDTGVSANKNVTTRSSNSSSPLSFSGQKFKRENDMKLARNQQLYRQQLSASSFDTASFTE